MAEAANRAEIQAPSSIVPLVMEAGGTAAERIRVRNTGTTTWTPAAGYRLGALVRMPALLSVDSARKEGT